MANNKISPPSEFEIKCPYCFSSFNVNEALFADLKDVAPRSYTQMSRYHNYFFGVEFEGRELPLIFAKTDVDPVLSPFKATTKNGDIAHTRVCPRCYSVVPPAAGHIKTFSIAVVGSNKKEKDVFFTVMMHRINKYMMTNFNAALIPADYRTASDMRVFYEESVYSCHKVPDGTAFPKPYTYEFKRFGNNLPVLRQDKDKITYNHCLLNIYNVDFEYRKKHPAYFTEVLSAADAVIVMVDSPDYLRKQESEPEFTDPWIAYLFEKVQEIFGVTRYKKPAAIVYDNINKVSGLNKNWARAVRKSTDYIGISVGFPKFYYRGISNSLRKALNKDFPAYSSVVRALFDPVTSMNFALNSCVDELDDGSIKPGIFETATEIPLLWVLSRLGIIPENGGRKIRRTVSGGTTVKTCISDKPAEPVCTQQVEPEAVDAFREETAEADNSTETVS